MPTGDFWDLSNPLKPTGLFDPDDVIHLPFDFSEWLADNDATYVSHTVTVDSKLQYENVGQTDGVVVVRVFALDPADLAEGDKCGVTVQCRASDGQKRSQTLWLKAKEL